jgi:hypothetical protein
VLGSIRRGRPPGPIGHNRAGRSPDVTSSLLSPCQPRRRDLLGSYQSFDGIDGSSSAVSSTIGHNRADMIGQSRAPTRTDLNRVHGPIATGPDVRGPIRTGTDVRGLITTGTDVRGPITIGTDVRVPIRTGTDVPGLNAKAGVATASVRGAGAVPCPEWERDLRPLPVGQLPAIRSLILIGLVFAGSQSGSRSRVGLTYRDRTPSPPRSGLPSPRTGRQGRRCRRLGRCRTRLPWSSPVPGRR